MYSLFIQSKLVYSFFIITILSIASIKSVERNDIEIVNPKLHLMDNCIDIRLWNFIKEINDMPTDREMKQGFCNRFFLHGMPGNGKTTLAHKVAELCKSKLIKPSALVNQETINTTFISAFEVLKEEKRVFVLIDNVDHISIEARQTLCKWLDKVNNNPRIIVWANSNKLVELGEVFTGRFGYNIIEIKNPNYEMREKIINFYVTKINNEIDPSFTLNKKQIINLAKNTDGTSIRALEYLLYAIQKDPQNIDNLVSKYKSDSWGLLNNSATIAKEIVTSPSVISAAGGYVVNKVKEKYQAHLASKAKELAINKAKEVAINKAKEAA